MGSPCDWQINKQNISERGQFLFESGQWSDCEFIVGKHPNQETLKGHKLFLVISSPVFEAIFNGSMTQKNDPIPIQDVQPEIFKAFLKYIYTDKVNLDCFELAYGLYNCAKKYLVPPLVKKCTKYLSSVLSPQTVCKAYELAEFFKDPILMEKCSQVIRNNTNKVLKDPSWKHIKLETLLTVLKENFLQIDSEIELFNAVECWAKAESARRLLDINDRKSLRSVIGSALQEIRFLTLSPKEFAEGPAMSLLLIQDEAFTILMNLLCSSKKPSMPEGFSLNKFKRKQFPPNYSSAVTFPATSNVKTYGYGFNYL